MASNATNWSFQMTNQTLQVNTIPVSTLSNAVRCALNVSHISLAAILGLSIAHPAFAQQENKSQTTAGSIEIIEVTSRKRQESIQNIPSSVQALSGAQLQQFGVEDFDDYILLLPSLSYQSAGPGQSQVYMRGASDGGDGNASGSQPSVAIYLDEQPVTAIGRNLDLHVYDIERIEALAGPQSTLFGASSQSGTLRIITNKPDASFFEAGVDFDLGTTKSGDVSHLTEGFVNIPLGDATALRLVGWNKHEGGFIDNIPGTHTSGLFTNGGQFSTATTDNSEFVEENFNDLDTRGARASLKTEFNDDWEALLTAIYQSQETNGVWFHDPDAPNGEIGDLEVQRFNPEKMDDSFLQTSITIEGDLGFADLIYTGSFMDRDVEFFSDYSDYSDYYSTSFIQYYGCEYYGTATVDCTNMTIAYQEDNNYKRNTHEIRLQSNDTGPFQYIAGIYFEDFEHTYRQEWVMEGIAKGPDFEQFGVPDLWYLTDQVREDNQVAIFGEITYDLNNKLSMTLGGRYFENESKLAGTSGYGVIAPGFPIVNVDSSVDDSGSIFKASISYQLTDKRMIYATWSEGYRPGGINRDETAIVAREYKADFVENIELGWKTLSDDQRLKFNGAIYSMEWTDMQLTRFDSSYGSPLGLTINVAESSILGIESDLVYMLTENWRVNAAFSYNQAELSKDLAIGNNFSPDGTQLPNVPKFKANISARYDFEVGEYNAHTQFLFAHVGESQNDIFKFSGDDLTTDVRQKLDAYNIVNFSTGVAHNSWKATLYIDNLTDERAQLTRGVNWDSTVVVNRPRTVGVSISYLFE
jgi:outer membrane receptor protein involved in Fe transport